MKTCGGRLLLMILALRLASGHAFAVVQANYSEDAAQDRSGMMARAVLIRYSAFGFPGGSGVIIGPRHVLTAKHGVQSWKPSELAVDLADDTGRRLQVDSCWTHPDAQTDLAVLRLVQKVDFDRLDLVDAATKSGDRVWLGGFGIYGLPGKPAGFGSFHGGYNYVSKVKNQRATVLLDKDSKNPEVLPAAFDSGSPVWVETTDGWVLSGITVTATHRERPDYGDRSAHQLIASSREWIAERMQEQAE